jgi:hypothetical protein
MNFNTIHERCYSLLVRPVGENGVGVCRVFSIYNKKKL